MQICDSSWYTYCYKLQETHLSILLSVYLDLGRIANLHYVKRSLGLQGLDLIYRLSCNRNVSKSLRVSRIQTYEIPGRRCMQDTKIPRHGTIIYTPRHSTVTTGIDWLSYKLYLQPRNSHVCRLSLWSKLNRGLSLFMLLAGSASTFDPVARNYSPRLTLTSRAVMELHSSHRTLRSMRDVYDYHTVSAISSLDTPRWSSHGAAD